MWVTKKRNNCALKGNVGQKKKRNNCALKGNVGQKKK